jgi:UDP-2-acetamido-3-amino-2,3-dideoxy-glucuronate N-acetyltransferase
MTNSPRLITLPQICDERGKLVIAEELRQLPFRPQRVFMLFDVPAGVTRGGHAHRQQEQFLMVFGGACTIVIDDGVTQRDWVLNSPTEGMYVPPGQWLVLKDFAQSAIVVVFASGLYDETDYIRDYDEFKQLAAAPALTLRLRGK